MKYSFVKAVCVLLVVLLVSVSFVGCQKDDGKDSGSTTKSTTAAPTTKATTQATEAGPEMEAGPWGKYDPPITITSCKIDDANMQYKPGKDVNNNRWIDLIREELGINLVYEWTVGTGEAWDHKIAVSMFSGDLPDFFHIESRNAEMYEQAVEAGFAMDMTDIFEEYATDQVKELLYADGGIGVEMAKRNGKLYCLPAPTAAVSTGNQLYIRKDCLENVGKDIPKSMDDVLELMRAFTEDDPDRNGKDDTYGLAISNRLFSGTSAVRGFFAGYGSYIGNSLFWIEKDGKLVCSVVQPETKEALQALATAYAKGYIDPEFAVKNTEKVDEEVGAGKFPMMYGIYYAAGRFSPILNRQIDDKVQPLMDVWVVAPPSEAGGPAYSPLDVSCSFHVVNAKCKNPEAVVKLLNLGTKMYNLPANEEGMELYKTYFTDDEGFSYFRYCPMNAPDVGGEISRHDAAMAVVDGRKTMGDVTTVYGSSAERIIRYENGDIDSNTFLQARAFGRQSAGSVMKELRDLGKLLPNTYYGPTTQGMANNLATLRDLQNEMILQVITGHKDISAFDAFVQDWHKLGGEQITQEVNDWYQSAKSK